MISTIQLTPVATARMYRGRRFHPPPLPEEKRKRLLVEIRRLQASSSPVMHYLGAVLELIARLN
jgi:hypothetical protein